MTALRDVAGQGESRFRRRAPGRGQVAWRRFPRDLLAAVARVASLALLGCALLLVLAVAAVLLPTDETNVLVRAVLDGALQVAGPFATVFDVERRALRAAANYGLAAAVYLLGARLVARLAR